MPSEDYAPVPSSHRQRLLEVRKILEKELTDAHFEEDAFGEWTNAADDSFDLIGCMKKIRDVFDA